MKTWAAPIGDFSAYRPALVAEANQARKDEDPPTPKPPASPPAKMARKVDFGLLSPVFRKPVPIRIGDFATYFPALLNRVEANQAYKDLLPLLKEHGTQHEVVLYGKTFTVPRYVCAVSERGAEGYTFSGNTLHADMHFGACPPLDALRDVVKERTGITEDLTFGLCNWYPDGTYKIGRHTDSEEEVVPDTPIISVTLCNGEGRDFWVWDPKTGEKRVIKLNHGDVLLFNRDVPHQLPERKRVKDGRINITFRQHKIKPSLS